MAGDPYDLERFVAAQDAGGTYDRAVAELRRDGSGGRNDLTSRQREVLQLIAEGNTSREIATALKISPKTVEFHKRALMDQTGLRTTAELTRYAVANGIVSL